MFARRTRGLFEFCMALLCLWAAYWHTPVGALLRGSVAKLFGVRSSARPLLAYYSGGSVPHAHDPQFQGPLPQLPPHLVITPALALGLGLHASLARLPEAERRHALQLARTYALDPDRLLDTAGGPEEAAALLERAGAKLGSTDAAVLAAFAGPEPARYALERALAEGIAQPSVDDLARHLPPGFEDPVARAHDALAFGVAYGLGWPLPEGTPITSGFGNRVHPILGTKKPHTGVDLGVPRGTPVWSAADGVVVRASEDGVNGRVLVIDHGRGVTTAYCHNQRLLVETGQAVARGQVISLSGNTGRSTGPHLHYQLELGGRPVDPLAFRPRAGPHIAGGAGP